MGLVKNIAGLVSNKLQIAFSATIKAVSGVFQIRNSSDTGYAKLQCAPPVDNEDAVPLDYLNSNSAAFVENTTKNVPANFPTLQAAIDFFGNKILGDNCEITADSGSYNEILDFSKINGELTIKGDTRTIIHQPFTDGLAIESDDPNAGSGVCTITSNIPGQTITVTGSTTNPDFTAAGIVPGDIMGFLDENGVGGGLPITAVAANVLTFGSAPPPMGSGIGSTVTIASNRQLGNSNPIITLSSPKTTIKMQGWLIDANGGLDTMVVSAGKLKLQNTLTNGSNPGINFNLTNRGVLEFVGKANISGGDPSIAIFGKDRCHIIGDYLSIGDYTAFVLMQDGATMSAENARIIGANSSEGGFVARDGGVINANKAIAIVGPSSNGFVASNRGVIDAKEAKVYVFGALAGGAIGFLAEYRGVIDAKDALVQGSAMAMFVTGFHARNEGAIHANFVTTGATAQYCATGYLADHTSYINAVGSSANNLGNTIDYSPSVSDTPGNILSVCTFS